MICFACVGRSITTRPSYRKRKRIFPPSGTPSRSRICEVVSQAAGTAMFGGGLSAEGRYHKGDQGSVTVKIVTDSPLLQSMMMLISNPMFASSSGGRLEKINGQTAIVKYETQEKRGDINVVIAGKVLVTVEGNDVSQDDIMAYAKAVDYDKILAIP